MRRLLCFFLASVAWAQPGFPPVVRSAVNYPSIADTYANVAATTCNATNKGQYAFTTDSIYTAMCSGSAWRWYFRGVPVTPPPTSGWTLDAKSGSSVTANADGTVTFFFAQDGGTNCCIDLAYRTGTATQTVTALICTSYGNYVSGSSDTQTATSDGLGFRDSGGLTAAYYMTVESSKTFFTTIDYWTNRTTYASTPTVYPVGYPGSAVSLSKLLLQDCHWFRVQEDSTNATFSYNYTGSANNWIQFFQASKTAFMASGTHNPAIFAYAHGNGQSMVLVSWLATNP
jgi:hypothetical protein